MPSGKFKDNSLKGKIEINLGIISNIFGDFETALSYYRRALLYFEKIKDLKRIAEIRHNMGMLYTKKNDLKTAVQEFDKSISFSMQCGNVPSLGLAYLAKHIFIHCKTIFILPGLLPIKLWKYAIRQMINYPLQIFIKQKELYKEN